MTTPSQISTARPAADTVDNAAATPEKEQPYAALGLKPDEYAQIREILGRRPTSGELAMYSVMWCEHCSYKSSKIYLRQFGEKVSRRDEEAPHGRHGRERRRRRHRRGLGGHLQGRVATTTRATSSRSRAPRPASAASCATSSRWAPARSPSWTQLRFGAIDHPDTARVVHGVVSRHLVLRQLPRPAQHRRRDLVRRRLPGQPARQRARGRRAAPRGPAPRQRHAAPATRSCCSAPAPAATASAAPSILASDTFDDGGPTKRPAVQVGDPFAEKVLIECCLELYRERPGRGHPGPRRRRHLVRDLRARRQRRRRHARRAREGAAARPHAHARGDPHEREPGAHDGDRRAREARRLPRGRREVGCRDQRARRGHRRPAASSSTGTARRSSTSTRARSRSTARSTSARSPTRPGSTRCRPTRQPRLPRARRRPTRCARSSSQLVGEPEPRRHGVGHQPVRLLRDGQHRAVVPRRRRHGPRRRGLRPRLRDRDRLQRPLLPARPVRGRASSPSPRRTATSPSPARCRSAVTRLPQLRQPREPRGHVAVLAGGRGPGRRMPRARHPGHRRQRLASTTRPAT